MRDGLANLMWLFVGGYRGVGRSLVYAGLVLALVQSWRFRTRRLTLPVDPPVIEGGLIGVRSFFRGPDAAVTWPPVLVAGGFVVGTEFRSALWQLVTAGLLTWIGCLAIRSLRSLHAARGDDTVAGAAVSLVVAVMTMLCFGAMLTIRLGVVPDPESAADPQLASGPVHTALLAVVVPLVASGALMYLAGLVRRRTGPGGTAALVRTKRIAERCVALPGRRVAVVVTGVLAVVVLFLAPGPGNLTRFGIATPEFGKIAYLVVLAGALTLYAPLLVGSSRRWDSMAPLMLPVVLFLGAAFAARLRGDVGPVVPLFLATLVLFGAVAAEQVAGTAGPPAGLADFVSRVRRGVRYALPWIVSMAVVVMAGAALLLHTGYIESRLAVSRDAWSSAWAPPCLSPTQLGAAASAVPHDVPSGYTLCGATRAAVTASENSQIARAMATQAHGGLWGNGLTDTTSGVVPAIQFDLASTAVWSKLGAVAVALLTALLFALARALLALPAELRGPAGRRPATPAQRLASLAALGCVVSVVSQYVWVLAASLAVAPHSGVTMPFIARGGQSWIALSALLLGVVACAYGASPAPRHGVPHVSGLRLTTVPGLRAPNSRVAGVRVRSARRWRRALHPGTVLCLVCLLLISSAVVDPYGGGHRTSRTCTVADATASGVVDPARCLTDLVAAQSATVDVEVAGRPALRRDRRAGDWVRVPGGYSTLADLAGLLGPSGEIDLGLAPLIDSSTAVSLSSRVAPPSRRGAEPTGRIALSLSPVLQRRLTSALHESRPEQDGGSPLAGGMVALDADSGRVLAASTAPTAPTSAPEPRNAAAVEAAFVARHPGFEAADSGLVRSCADPDTAPAPDRCVRWTISPANVVTVRSERRFVGGLRHVALPDADVNRALSQRYGPGSTFKILVAIAYLRQPGTSAEDLVDAPDSLTVDGRVIGNAGRPQCPGVVDGRESLITAAAVSCNTAFVLLAERLGWPAIERVARSLCFAPVASAALAPRGACMTGPDLGDAALGSRSVVPASIPAGDIGTLANTVLGGGDVGATVLQMATVMATVANGGIYRSPQLITATSNPGQPSVSYLSTGRRVFSARVSEEVRKVLSATTGPLGTAFGLRAPDDRPVWVKTGTHELTDSGLPAPGRFATVVAWLVGFVDTATGPVSFAVALEGRDEHTAAVRTRWLAQLLITELIKERG